MERFRSDGRRFPAYTYKESSLLWQGNEWRQPDSVERSLIMGIPPSVLDSVAPKSPAGQRECAKCSLVGNSFHVPSAMLAIILACQLLPHAASCPAPMYGGLECRLRGCIQGTAWQPGLLDTWPGVRTSESLVGVRVFPVLIVARQSIWPVDVCRFTGWTPKCEVGPQMTRAPVGHCSARSVRQLWLWKRRKGRQSLNGPVRLFCRLT